MSYRKHRLFPRALSEVMKEATSPLMKKHGQFYAALRRDWVTIVGTERARDILPLRAQFSRHEHEGATLHLSVSAAKTVEIGYMQQEILEQLARYFGYRAVTKLVLHANYDMVAPTPPITEEPRDLNDIFQRLKQQLANKT